MAINTHITDPTTEQQASVIGADITNGTDETRALVVATRELNMYENSPKFFVNSDYGINMNQNAEATGLPSGIHNGIDDVLWTASSIAGGKFTFDSTDIAHSGTQSIKIDNAAIGDTMQLDAGSSQNISTYRKISIWANVDKDWKNGDSISLYGWDGGVVGNAVNLEDYFTWGDFDNWHDLAIPLSDMALQTANIDALRMTINTAEGKSPKFYMDDIQLQGSSAQGDPIEYVVAPAKSKWLFVDKIKMLFVGVYDSTLANSSMPKIPYDSFLGLATLPIGITYKKYLDGDVVQSFSLHNVADILSFPDSTLIDTGGDGTNTWLSLTFILSNPILLKNEDNDSISLTVNDDLSSLLVLRASAGCREETR